MGIRSDRRRARGFSCRVTAPAAFAGFRRHADFYRFLNRCSGSRTPSEVRCDPMPFRRRLPTRQRAFRVAVAVGARRRTSVPKVGRSESFAATSACTIRGVRTSLVGACRESLAFEIAVSRPRERQVASGARLPGARRRPQPAGMTAGAVDQGETTRHLGDVV